MGARDWLAHSASVQFGESLLLLDIAMLDLSASYACRAERLVDLDEVLEPVLRAKGAKLQLMDRRRCKWEKCASLR